MAYFLLQGAYSTEVWNTLISNPVNRVEAIRPAIESMGGRIEGSWLSFGEYDVVLIMQMPDNISAAAFALAVAAGGAFKSSKTTPLLSMDEGVEAMTRASATGYQPPPLPSADRRTVCWRLRREGGSRGTSWRGETAQ